MADPKPKRTPFSLPKKLDFNKMNYVTTSQKVAPKPVLTKSFATTNSRPAQPIKFGKNGLPQTNGTRKSLTPSRSVSRTPSHEPRDKRNGKTPRPNRSSPALSTPVFSEDEDEAHEDETSEPRRKRPRLHGSFIDEVRKVRDSRSFSENDTEYTIIHAADIANNQILQHDKFKFAEHFTVLGEDEEECPIIDLQYPCGGQTERYQLVRPVDKSDYKPLSEMVDNMKMVAEYYLEPSFRTKITGDEFGAGGLVAQLDKHAKDNKLPGAQQRFLQVIEEYNDIVCAKRKDGTITSQLDSMTSPLPRQLVEHIVLGQIYARTVSPHVEIVTAYQAFSDNVYGELKPKFLSTIFRETRLRSDQIFVDLGSGVGNCVMQAALEIGCESWGCEVMSNPASLAEASALEFPSRCRMWGIKPGRIRLIHDDFTKNTEILEVLKKADVVLVNNQAFSPELNDQLKHIFLDLKEGCQIVSLKYFRDPAHKVKETNINDPANQLRVVEKERFSDMVSWTDDPGKWYLHVKDWTEVRKVKERHGL